MFARAGHPGVVHDTSDVVAGVADADVVLLQLRVGGQAARHGDETFPHEVGCIGQETTGPGGFAKALRTVPVVLDIAEAVRRHAAPDAWIIDFTNPVGIVTRALLEAGHRAVGLCNVAIGFQRRFARMLDVAPEAVSLGHVGLNHLTWERSVTVTRDGASEDVLPRLLATRLPELAEEVELPGELLSLQEAIPSYYLRYFYAHDEVLREQQGAPTRAEAVLDVERRLLAQYADPSVDTKPEELALRGGAFYSEAAVDLMASLTGNRGDTQVVNVRNDGTLGFLPDDHVDRGARGRDGGRPHPGARRAARARDAGPRRPRRRVRAARPRRRGGGWTRPGAARACSRIRSSASGRRRERLTDLLLEANARHLAWAR